MVFRVTLENDESGWVVAECPALPGCISQGRDREEYISGKDAVKAFAKAGWRVTGQSRQSCRHEQAARARNLSIPQNKELATGTLRKLIRVAELSVEEFVALM